MQPETVWKMISAIKSIMRAHSMNWLSMNARTQQTHDSICIQLLKRIKRWSQGSERRSYWSMIVILEALTANPGHSVTSQHIHRSGQLLSLQEPALIIPQQILKWPWKHEYFDESLPKTLYRRRHCVQGGRANPQMHQKHELGISTQQALVMSVWNVPPCSLYFRPAPLAFFSCSSVPRKVKWKRRGQKNVKSRQNQSRTPAVA